MCLILWTTKSVRIFGVNRGHWIFGRSLHNTMSEPLRGREFEVPVPWGKIAGREWGDPDGHPWVVLHGWLDNCGSFDPLARIFPPGHRLLCIDVPGHGFSSHYPKGLTYHYMDGIQYIRRVSNHFRLSKFSLMGHSMGGGMISLYAASHPDVINKLIVLDNVRPLGGKAQDAVKRVRSHIDHALATEEKISMRKPPMYTYQEAKSRLLQGSSMIGGNKDVLTDSSADILLRRGLREAEHSTEVGEGKEKTEEKLYHFNYDLRRRVPAPYLVSDDTLLAFAEALQCPFLLVKASESSHYEADDKIQRTLQAYAKNSKFHMMTVEGTHHVHLNNPERVLGPIEEFLSKYDNTSNL